jgi:hypothetical protein
MNWEYTATVIEESRTPLVTELNNFGKERWELCHIERTANGWIAVFKRQLP